MSHRIEVTAVEGLPEVRAGDDLAAMLAAALPDLADGDVLVVTSKVVSKAEGRVVAGVRLQAVEAETQRVVARRGTTTIARTRHGLTLAAAGVDASNTTPGTVVLLPVDPDGSARDLRARLRALTGSNLGVVLSDTAGRPWREGQTDIAVGCAGLLPLDDHAGRRDAHGNELEVTAPASADELAAAADLVMGKVGGRPVAVVRGADRHVLPAGDDGPGATALLRAEDADMFALGAREAVVAAACRDDPDALDALLQTAGPRARPVTELLATVADPTSTTLQVHHRGAEEAEVRGDPDIGTATELERLCTVGVVHGWRVAADDRNQGRCRIVLRWGKPGP